MYVIPYTAPDHFIYIYRHTQTLENYRYGSFDRLCSSSTPRIFKLEQTKPYCIYGKPYRVRGSATNHRAYSRVFWMRSPHAIFEPTARNDEYFTFPLRTTVHMYERVKIFKLTKYIKEQSRYNGANIKRHPKTYHHHQICARAVRWTHLLFHFIKMINLKWLIAIASHMYLYTWRVKPSSSSHIICGAVLYDMRYRTPALSSSQHAEEMRSGAHKPDRRAATQTHFIYLPKWVCVCVVRVIIIYKL